MYIWWRYVRSSSSSSVMWFHYTILFEVIKFRPFGKTYNVHLACFGSREVRHFTLQCWTSCTSIMFSPLFLSILCSLRGFPVKKFELIFFADLVLFNAIISQMFCHSILEHINRLSQIRMLDDFASSRRRIFQIHFDLRYEIAVWEFIYL